MAVPSALALSTPWLWRQATRLDRDDALCADLARAAMAGDLRFLAALDPAADPARLVALGLWAAWRRALDASPLPLGEGSSALVATTRSLNDPKARALLARAEQAGDARAPEPAALIAVLSPIAERLGQSAFRLPGLACSRG